MEKILRGASTTASERILADLGDQAFLRLWSYPNLFIDKKKNKLGDGKELCDMLVVCGDNVIIFSDKMIGWQADKPIEVAWPRFYKRAISESLDQILGADRWIRQFPNRIFTDPSCTQPLPIELPPTDQRRTHGVIIAGGAVRASRMYFKDDSGTFLIRPDLKGDMHVDFSLPTFTPFSIGDVNPDGFFIHVFDNEFIKTLLARLDTISDFTRYLNKRAEYIRSGLLALAPGEEELLGRYLSIGMQTGSYDFEPKRKKKFKNFQAIIVQGEWREYLFSDGCFAKTLADRISYVWDKIINLFAENIVDGTSVSILGEEPSTRMSEQGLRFMALEDRFSRRMLVESVASAMTAAETRKAHRFVRTILPGKKGGERRIAYVFLILAYPTHLEEAGKLPGGYEQYRRTRAATLQAYCLNVLNENRHLEVAVGIAVDASPLQTGRKGGSEDLIAIQSGPWTEEILATLAEDRLKFDIMNPEKMEHRQIPYDEFPVAK